jgi:hypothetical protein
VRLKPTQLRAALEFLRVQLAEAAGKGDDNAKRLEAALDFKFGIKPLERCPGEAHENPNIDGCMMCAPRWGWTGETV